MEKESVPPPLVAGLSYNLKKGAPSRTEDMEAEYDSPETVEAIRGALEAAGVRVRLLEADAALPEKLRAGGVDIVFNIAEGTNGRGREAQVPAILSFFGIPFTGSDETTLCMALDKALTKRYLSTFGIRTPAYFTVESTDFTIPEGMRFPVIVKPDCEGSSKGIADCAVADTPAELDALIGRDLSLYGPPLLAEEFIDGREFTVGLLGSGGDTQVFEPMEICYRRPERENRIYSYRVKRDYSRYVEYRCPAALDTDTAAAMKQTALRIHQALGCRDFSRVDFRLSPAGEIYFIEINPLPGLAPGYSDYPMLAQLCGVEYPRLVLGVLNSALKRYGLREVAPNRGAVQ